MSIKAIYNEVANQYDKADCFGSITHSHHSAIEQIKHANLEYKPNFKVLDMGIGDGAFLRKIKKQMPLAEFTGIDISKEMLKHATSDGLLLRAIEASAAEATDYIPLHSQDLVVAHFISAYVPLNILFKQAQMLTRPSGHFSMITTTYDSFPIAQQHLANFIAEDTLLSCIVGHYYKAALKHTTVASGEEELFQSFNQHQFEIIDHQRLSIPVSFNNIDELTQFGFESGWLINGLLVSILPNNFVLQRIKRVFSKIFTFPFHDTQVIEIVLAKKLG